MSRSILSLRQCSCIRCRGFEGKGVGIMDRFDFHVHTTASDGGDCPSKTIDLAQERRLHAIALTDHNTLASAVYCVAYERHLEQSGETWRTHAIPGIEISSRLEVGGAMDIVHLLGLGIDPLKGSMVNLCDTLDGQRAAEQETSIAHARSKGYAICREAEARVIRSFWGRGALARELVLEGHFDVVDEAYHAVFDSGFLTSSNLRQCVPAELAVEAIKSAGGLCVLAHPLRDETSHGLVPRHHAEERVRKLGVLGIDAIEAYYSAFNIDDCKWLEGLAKTESLLVSVGSDHHDTNHRDRMGSCCTDGRNHGSHAATLAKTLGLE